MEQLLQWDSDLLVWINAHHTAAWDDWMWTISQAKAWIGLYVTLILMLVYIYRGNRDWRSWVPCMVVIACIAASAGLADLVSSGILKPWVARLRPTHSDLGDMLHIVNNYRGGKYGFPSSHAADTMAVATATTLLMVLYRKLSDGARWPSVAMGVGLLLLYVVPNCYSRMYLGVHYPLDIVCGLLTGATCATGVYFAAKKMYFDRFFNNKKREEEDDNQEHRSKETD